jgi:hypothetical protein
MAKAWSKIVQSETPTKKMTLDDILHFGSWSSSQQQPPVAKVQEETLTEFEKIIGNKTTPWIENEKVKAQKQEDDSAFPVNASSVVF